MSGRLSSSPEGSPAGTSLVVLAQQNSTYRSLPRQEGRGRGPPAGASRRANRLREGGAPPPEAPRPNLLVERPTNGRTRESPAPPGSATLAWRPVLVIRLGRGRVGGTTILDLFVQWARAAGRVVLIADGDLRNSTLAGLISPGTDGGALRPPSDELLDMKDFFTGSVATAIERGASLIVDFGGGDRVMQDYDGRELAIVEMCEGVGMVPLAVYVPGPNQMTSSMSCRSGARARLPPEAIAVGSERASRAAWQVAGRRF